MNWNTHVVFWHTTIIIKGKTASYRTLITLSQGFWLHSHTFFQCVAWNYGEQTEWNYNENYSSFIHWNFCWGPPGTLSETSVICKYTLNSRTILYCIYGMVFWIVNLPVVGLLTFSSYFILLQHTALVTRGPDVGWPGGHWTLHFMPRSKVYVRWLSIKMLSEIVKPKEEEHGVAVIPQNGIC